MGTSVILKLIVLGKMGQPSIGCTVANYQILKSIALTSD